MKQVLFATTNQQKVKRLRALTQVDLLDLSSLGYQIAEPEEVGKDGMEIAILKARHYFAHLEKKMPVLSQDDTLKMEVKPEDDPGSHIKAPVIERFGEFNDQNALRYYTDLAKKYGGTIPMYFEYGHAVCFSDGEETVSARKSRLAGRLVTTAHENESTKGYFLSAILQVNIAGAWKYYSELTPEELIEADAGIAESLQRLLA